MTAERLAEIHAFIEENPPTATLLRELHNEVMTLQGQVRYYERQLAEKYRQVIELERKLTWPSCEECGANLVEDGERGEMTCRMCALEAEVTRLKARVRT